MTSNDLTTFLTILGGLILFVSWISENYLQKKWEGQREESESTRVELSRGEDRNSFAVFQVDLFATAYNKDPNAESLKNYIKALSRYSKNLLSMQMFRADILAIDKTKYEKDYPVKVREELFEKENLINEYATANNIKELSKIAQEISDEMHTNNDNAIYEANEYLKTLNSTISFYNKAFLVCYIIGSSFLGIAFAVNYWSQP